MKAVYFGGGGGLTGPVIQFIIYDNTNLGIGVVNFELALGTEYSSSIQGATLAATMVSKIIIAAAAADPTWIINAADVLFGGFEPYSPTEIAAIQAALPAVPVYSTPTFSGITTATKLSATRDAFVSYDIDAALTISLLAGQSVTATLQYADNSGMSTNVVTVSSQITSISGLLGLSNTQTLKVSGRIPANKFRKVTFSVTGSATTPTSLKAGEEVLL